MELISFLNSLGNDIENKYSSLNYGGCCVFAAIVGRELENIGIPVKGLACQWGASIRPPIYSARRNMKNKRDIYAWQENGVYFGHVGLEIRYKGKVYHYDSNGVAPRGKKLMDLEIYRGRMTVEELEIIAGNKAGWNTAFGRSNIPALRRQVRKAFKGAIFA